MGITLTMKLLTHESKFFKKIDTLCDPIFLNSIIIYYLFLQNHFFFKISIFNFTFLRNFSNK
jgi:hypothetical protein